MGEVAEEINKASFLSSTNWTISKGSLSDSISFETPISSINDEEEYQEHQDDSKTLKHHQQQFVVLNQPSSSLDDSSPCEIKLSFEQRHEIRQVYVRSTARIFEIYYEMAPESSNEYLCTVRCGLAAKEQMPLGPNDTAEATSAHSEGSDDQKEHPQENVKGGSNGSVVEDGWVEVNVPTSALLDSKGYSLVRNINRDAVKCSQDFYEATAEITDSNPCISITLRLLSLHTKGCIHLEEIYIFGEPVGPSESDVETDPMKSTAGSSMMAMLVPTLLQISKTGLSRITQDNYASDVRQELKHPAAESVGHCVGSKTHEEVPSCAPSREEANIETVTKGNPEAGQMRSDEPVQGTGLRPGICDHQNDSPSDRMERVLNQLVGRVCRIEAFCSRFEENMLKPISNIETRLEHLEQQLEALTMRSQLSEFYPQTRISAPDFSCIESETNSLAHDENEDRHYAVSDIASKDAKFDKHPESFGDESESSSPINDRNEDHSRVESESLLSDACESVVAPRLFPCLIVTAPEFSNKDDDDDYGNEDDGSHCDGVGDDDDRTCSDDFVSSKIGCPSFKPSLSLDDALAMALTGFMTSSDHAPKSNNPWTVEAPDFPDENNDSIRSLSSPLRSVRADSSSFMEVNGAQNSMTFSLVPYGSCQDNEVQVMGLTTAASTEAVDGSCGDKSVNQSIAGDSDEEEREVDASQGTYVSCEAVEGSCGQKCANPSHIVEANDDGLVRNYIMEGTTNGFAPHIVEANDDGIVRNYIMEGTTNGFATMNTSQAELQVSTSSDVSSTEAVIRECPLLEEGLDESSDEKSVNQTITANSEELTGEVSNYKMEETNTSSEHNMLNMNSILNLSRNSKEDVELLRNPDEERLFDQNFIVDFELPILDVKFTPVEHSNSRCSIESLLSASANDVGNPCTQGDGSNVVISEEEDGSKGSEVDRILIDVDNFLKNTGNSSKVSFFACEDFFLNNLKDSCAQGDNSSVVTGQSQVLLDNESNGPEDANHLVVEKSDDTESNFQSPGIDGKGSDLAQGIGSKIPDWFEISSYI